MIIGITFLSFLLSYLSPGDPAQILLNNQGVKASEEALQSTRHELGLDRPMIVQYGDWLMDLCRGDMGTSYKSNRPVLSEMTAKIPGTLILTVTALGVTMLLSIPLGTWCAWHCYAGFDVGIDLVSLVYTSGASHYQKRNAGILYRWPQGKRYV